MADKTTLNRKVRNPKVLSKWLDIWTAKVDTETYTIEPSEHWKFGTENHLATFNAAGNIIDGPTFDNSGNFGSSFLNEKGEWVAISSNSPSPITITPDVESHTVKITHNKPNNNDNFSGGPVGPSQDVTATSVIIPQITYDDYGHITATNDRTYSLPVNSSSSSGIVSQPDGNTGANKVWMTDNNKVPAWRSIPTNTASQAGIVAAGGSNNINKIWATDSQDGTPTWRSVTTNMILDRAITSSKIAEGAITNNAINSDAQIDASKINTKLLGVAISTIKPENVDLVTSFYDLKRYIPNRYLFPYLIATQTIEANHGNSSNPQQTEITVIIHLDSGNATLTSTNLSSNNISAVSTLYVFSDDLSTIFSPQHLLSEYLQVAQDDYDNTSIGDFYNNNTSVVTRICLDMQQHFNRRMQYINTYAEEDKINAHEIASQCTSDLNNNLFNDWDYEHLGIWVEI